MDQNIPQIKPDTKPTVPDPKDPPAQKESILIPKINPPAGQSSSRGGGNKVFELVKKVNRKVLLVIGAIILAFLVLIILPFLNVYLKGKALYAQSLSLADAAKSQNIPQIRDGIVKTDQAVDKLKSAFFWIGWSKFIPFFGAYVSDFEHGILAYDYGLEAADITLTTIEPYADLIGLTGGATPATDGAQTAQERIDFLVKSIPQIVPQLDEISQKAQGVKAEVVLIDPDRYPISFRGVPIRERVRQGITLIEQGATLVTDGRPLLEATPYLLGIEKERSYLVLFQNDKELRPTGGFLTAYSIMKVDEGKFEPVSSNDIYNLDTPYRPVVPAPEPIIKYLKGPYLTNKNLRLRDMNWSPDFSESMDVFAKEAEKVGIRNIDGIIAVDTQVVVNLLDVLGEIGVPGFGNFSTKIVSECGCPQVIYELESFADIEGPVVWDPAGTGKIIYAPPNYDNRKKIVGPLMNSILANAMGQPKEKLPDLFEAGFKSLLEKHVLLYTYDEKAQKASEDFGIAGRIEEYEGDYLHINDANLGGRKSNLYVTQEVEQDITVARDGSVEKTVTITYNNPKEHDGWLNSVLPNWVRVYVPKGSELVSFEGVEEKEDAYEDLGKTVFAGYFKLRPQGVAKVTLTYKLPMKVKGTYNLLVQKQPGTDGPLYRISVGRHNEEFFLKTDKEFKFGI